MDYDRVYKNFDISQFSSDELEEFGRKLCRQVLLHIGMVRYTAANMKTMDLTAGDLGRITDEAQKLVLGLDVMSGIEAYKESLRALLELVGAMEIKEGVKGSIRKDLKKSFIQEMRDMRISFNNRVGYWDQIGGSYVDTGAIR
ncbi:hypothetical protein [Bacillus haynesii]|uniref:hypothetical protein n=1 Tax=Bacillus haynesii TaxID=1925021 RepID=UPI0035DE0DDE